MRTLPILISCVFICAPALAGPWVFEQKIPVTQAGGPRVFHHLESAGRKNIAFTGDTIAVIWEDNRSGTPQIYVAFKKLASNRFNGEMLVNTDSSRQPAYEPVIVGLADGRFLMGWEQDGAVWLRTGEPDRLDPVIRLAAADAGQLTLAAAGTGRAFAAWTEQHGQFRRVFVARIDVNPAGARIGSNRGTPVDSEPPSHHQLYPALAIIGEKVVVAWEDRRHGHTVLYTSETESGQEFSPPRLLNEIVQKSSKYGRGNGVTRVALAVFGDDHLGAAWMDKRGFKTGYEIYAATGYLDNSFGANHKVQDEFGDGISQWHPAIAGGARGDLAVVWNDDRDGTSDILLSWRTEQGWSDDHPIAPASGEGEQTNASITMDTRGNLHVIWLESEENNGPTRLFYTVGQPAK